MFYEKYFDEVSSLNISKRKQIKRDISGNYLKIKDEFN